MRATLALFLLLVSPTGFAECECMGNVYLRVIYQDRDGKRHDVRVLDKSWETQASEVSPKSSLEFLLQTGAIFETVTPFETKPVHTRAHGVVRVPFVVPTGRMLDRVTVKTVERVEMLNRGCAAHPPPVRATNRAIVANSQPAKIETRQDRQNGTHYRIYFKKGPRLIWLGYAPERGSHCVVKPPTANEPVRAIAQPGPSDTRTNSSPQLKLPVSYVFTHKGDDSCTLHTLNIKSGKIQAVYKPKRCPIRMFRNGPGGLVLEYAEGVRVLTLKPAASLSPIIALPDPTPPQGFSRARLDNIGTANGLLTLDMRAVGPADGHHAFIYQLKEGKWVLVRGQSCGKWDWDSCNVKPLVTVPTGFARFEQMLPWHEAQRNNPYVHSLQIKKKISESRNEEDRALATLRIGSGANQSVLVIKLVWSSNLNGYVAKHAQYRILASPPREIINIWGDNLLAGKYLISYRSHGGGHSLLDLTTGKFMELDSSLQGVWLYQ